MSKLRFNKISDTVHYVRLKFSEFCNFKKRPINFLNKGLSSLTKQASLVVRFFFTVNIGGGDYLMPVRVLSCVKHTYAHLPLSLFHPIIDVLDEYDGEISRPIMTSCWLKYNLWRQFT
jgi:F0F1-type ATP synthase membrane subunit a